MPIMRYLYILVAVLAVALAVTCPIWLPSKWFGRKIRKQGTPSGWGGPSAAASSSSSESSTTDGGTDLADSATSSGDKPPSSQPAGSSPQQALGDDAEIRSFPFDPSTPGSVKVFSTDELAHFTTDSQLYLVVLGEVFDVTSGRHFYSKDAGGYHCFIGKDNSAAFHTGEFTKTKEDVRELPPTAVQGIVGWRTFFRKHETYKFVGVVTGIYFDEKGQPTPALDEVLKLTASAKAGEEEDARRAKLFPRCNMHYDGLKVETRVWCEGFRDEDDVNRHLKKFGGDRMKDAEFPVLRMVHFTSAASGAKQQDCRCLRLNKAAESAVGAEPFPTARVEEYFPEKGCHSMSPWCFWKG